jgi:crotonobetainyl-CoA:carnitine CoA-transferase CaiB-like acyl-CoA transferase
LKPEVVAEVKAEIAAAMREKTFAEWSAVFAALDSCTEPVLSFAEACEHPHTQARGLLVDVPKPGGGTQRQLASAIKFSATPPRYDFIGAPLGAHTDDILGAAGIDAAQRAALRKAGVIA